MDGDGETREAPELIPVRPPTDPRRVRVGIALAFVVVAVGIGLAALPRLWPTTGPPPSAAPTEPTDEHVEAARWVAGYLKYLYQLTLYPADATSPSPHFLFTER